MLQANELLYGILKTLGKIEENTRSAKGSGGPAPQEVGSQIKNKISVLSNLGPSLLSFGRVKPKTIKDFFTFIEQFVAIGAKSQKGAKGLKNLAESLNLLGQGLPGLATGLDALGRIKQRQVHMALTTLESLYNFMEEKGDASSTRKVDKAVKTFDKIAKSLQKIAKPIKDISLSFAYLGIGILAFAGSLLLTAMIMKLASPKDVFIFLGVAILGLLVVFGALALANKFIKKGSSTLVEMGIGMAALALGLVSFALAVSLIPKILGKETGGGLLKSMLVIGGVIVGSALIFALLGTMIVEVALGALTILMLGGTFFLLAVMIKKIVGISNELKDVDIRETLGHLIGGVLGGMIDGISVLSGGKKGFAGIGEFIKNSAKIFAGIVVLMAMSVALSMFARAVSAFAELNSMRIIEGYDKNGKPIFGEKVNLSKVADNISYSISTFLTALLESTEGLTKQKAIAIRKMGRALTGRRGILSAVIQFADAMKIYAEFGEKNEIGYIDYDDKGNEIRKKVAAKTVVKNMISSFLYFTEQLFSKSESEFGDGEPEGKGISGKQKRRMKRMSKALVGRNGILGAVMQFADTLKMFAEFGPNNEIPILDAEGKPVMENGKPKILSMGIIAQNIVSALTTFSDTLATKLEKSSAKDAKKAIQKYSGVIEELSKFSESLSALEKTNDTISNLAKSLNDLSVSLDGFDTAKLSKLAAISVSAGVTSGISDGTTRGTTAEKIQTTSKVVNESSIPTTNWDVISAQIGVAVGSQLLDAMKKGQVKFEFSPSSPGKGVLSFD
jgi:hypothetical protein